MIFQNKADSERDSVFLELHLLFSGEFLGVISSGHVASSMKRLDLCDIFCWVVQWSMYKPGEISSFIRDNGAGFMVTGHYNFQDIKTRW